MSTLKAYINGQWKNVNGQVVGDTLPIGAIVPFGGWDAPTGWLICDGTLLNKTAYPELFNAIGYSFGGEDGGSTFGLPDLRGRVPVGEKDNDSDFDGMGVTGGSKYLQEHNHEIFGGYGTGSTNKDSITFGAQKQADGTYDYGYGGEIFVKNSGTGNSGNLQPYQTVNYIIKAKQSAGLVANVSNTYSTSQIDTYSCNYVNDTFGINNYSNVEDGYIKFPTGLMIQWGSENLSRTATNQQEISINFPQTFNTVFTVVASLNDPGYGLGELNEGVGVLNITSSSFTCLFKSLTNTAHSVTVRWIAIGKWK